ncbi:MAG: hypothetical protein K9M45_00285 [Kiritimatiellales bacterium]|nr:hypothetical protein [Kiritimatiellales bacterium]
MKIICSLILVPLITAITLQARLGETVGQCDSRYGARVKSNISTNGVGSILYAKNDLTIYVHFIKGSADLIRYSNGEFTKLTYPLADRLVQINGRTKDWELTTKVEITDYEEFTGEKITIPVDPIKWKTTDGRIVASFSVSKGTLEIKTTKHDEINLEHVLQGL